MTKVAIVTGANQGLGFALAEGLAQQLTMGDVVYLTGRSRSRVRAATLRIDKGCAAVHGEVLDVRDDAAIKAFAGAVVDRHGGIDIVFSNAAARLTPGMPAVEQIGLLVDTNNLGTTRMLRAFDPIMRPGGRIVVIASDFGSLRWLAPHLHERFDTDAVSLDDIDAAMLAWRESVLAGRAGDEGWPDWINIPSKVGQVAAVRALARERRSGDAIHGGLVVAVCPGLTDTGAARAWRKDMADAQTPAEAAAAPLRLALTRAAVGDVYGELVQFGNVIPWR